MNFGIIGYGTIGKTHAQVIESLTDAKLTAIATRTPEKVRMAGEQHRCAFYTAYREMLKRDDIFCEAVRGCDRRGEAREAAHGHRAGGIKAGEAHYGDI